MKLYFKLSEKAVKAELRKGNEVSERQIVNVNLEKIDKKYLPALSGDMCKLVNDEMFFTKGEYFNFSNSRSNKFYSVKEIDSLDYLEEILKAHNEELKYLESKKKKEKEAEKKAINDFISGENMKLHGDGLYPDFNGSFPNNFDERWKDYPEVIASKNRYLALQKEKQEERKIKKAEKLRKEEAEKEAIAKAKENLKSWAKEKGSELLKLRIKHEQNWLEIAIEEYANSYLPNFRVLDEPEDYWYVKNATLSQLQTLEKYSAENKDFDFEIKRLKFDNDFEYYYRSYIVTQLKIFNVFSIEIGCEIEDVSDEDDE